MQARGFSLVMIIALTLTAACTASRTGTPWTTYGTPIRMTKQTTLHRLLDPKTDRTEHEVLVRGTIQEVCQSKGCWMIVTDRGQSIRVEFQDYGFFVPWEGMGKAVRMQGVVRERVLSRAEREHIASESRHSSDGPIQVPERMPVFVARGVEIQGGGAIGAKQLGIIEGRPREADPGRESHDDHRH